MLEILGNMLVLAGHEGCHVVERNCTIDLNLAGMVSFHSVA